MFELKFGNSLPEVYDLNPRREGATKEVLAIDISIKGELMGDHVAAILGAPVEVVQDAFWDLKISGGPVRLAGITSISSWARFPDCKVMIGDLRFDGVTAKKFRIEPKPGGIAEVKFQIGISDVPESDVGRLTHFLNQKVMVWVEGETDLFDQIKGEATDEGEDDDRNGSLSLVQSTDDSASEPVESAEDDYNGDSGAEENA